MDEDEDGNDAEEKEEDVEKEEEDQVLLTKLTDSGVTRR